MLSEVPLPRLLEGMAATLRSDVAPAVGDEFALMQLRAIEEVLRNLAVRVDWATAELDEEITGQLALLDLLSAAGWPGEPPPPRSFATAEEAIAYRARLLPLLADALEWAQSQGEAEKRMATEHLRAVNKRERARLKSGMYS